MRRIVILDAGPAGLVVCSAEVPAAAHCMSWLAGLESSSAEVVLPTIVDFEVRRELLRIGATAKLRALDELGARFDLVDVSAEAFRRAAEFWAIVRRAGRPTADPKALDADTLVAGVAATIADPWDDVIVATTNVGHFARFPGIDARPWGDIH